VSRPVDIAVVGATGLVGEALLERLGDAPFPVGSVHALASSRSAGRRVDAAGRRLKVVDLEGFDFGGCDVVVFAAPRAVVADHLPRALAAGCRVVDLSGLSALDPDVPLLVAGLSRGIHGAQRVAAPSALTVLVATVLRPLLAQTDATSIDVLALSPASALGRTGVEGLARETADLLNARPRGVGAFPQQIAFNLFPTGDRPGGCEADDLQSACELQRALGDPAPAVTVTNVRVPVFFGIAAALRVATRAGGLDADGARELLAVAPGIRLAGPDDDGGMASPVTHSAGSDDAFVGPVRDGGQNGILVLWAVADNIRHGAARNALGIIEMIVKSID
jgi:aspartate-semialdehyde dehydrogenase